MVRPSTRSTTRTSSVTTTRCARASVTSLGSCEVLIPSPYQQFFSFDDQPLDLPQFGRTESAAAREPHRCKPTLCPIGFALDVHMRRLVPIRGVEEETVRPLSKNRWHARVYGWIPASSKSVVVPSTLERLRSQRRLLCRHVACGNSKTGGMIAPGCATRSARCLAASGVVGCGRLQPTSSRRGLFFERNRQFVRPLRPATAETEGVISCGSLAAIAFSRARYLTVTNEKPRVD